METAIYFVGWGIIGLVGFWVGYDFRKYRMQKRPFQFAIGEQPTVMIDNRGPVTEVTVQNKKLTKVTYLK